MDIEKEIYTSPELTTVQIGSLVPVCVSNTTEHYDNTYDEIW